MNKLKKAPLSSPEPRMAPTSSNEPISRTLKFAQDVSVSLSHSMSSSPKTVTQRSSRSHAMHFEAPAPRPSSTSSQAEQYWAARAFTAETLLSAHAVHQQELQDLVRAEEVKRAYEMSVVAEEHRARHASLEKLVTLLLGLVAALVALVIYLATHYTRHSASQRSPYHFTIPILSPFASVVEHETSVVGSRTIALVVVILAVLVFLFIRIRFA